MHTECLGLVCRECGKRIPEAECALSCPDCGAPMRVMFSEASLRQALSAGLPAPEGRSFLRQWRSILPISDESLIDRVSLGEAETPLLPSHRYGEKTWYSGSLFQSGTGADPVPEGPRHGLVRAQSTGIRLQDRVPVLVRQQRGPAYPPTVSRAGLNPVVFVQKHVYRSENSLKASSTAGAWSASTATWPPPAGSVGKTGQAPQTGSSVAAQILTASPRSVPSLTASSSSLGGPRIRF